ncbi:MAG: hypothetical protein RMM51_01390 [Verrucomicrobiae bacterium]|nr:hypothetical protein [Verrucomicrobiae bacterium]
MKRTNLWIAGFLVGLWAVLFLPNLRTNPNWYGDEGEWMEKCWTFIHGTPRVGPIINDFVFPYPYPPLYMLVNGTLLRVFGYDLVVGRALGAVTALGAAGLLFWIGCRLRDRTFGVLCATAFLVYAEANMNFRWVRSHPMAGTLALASVGFLVRYVQERRLRDALLAGLMCALATATNYFTYPLIAMVAVTVLLTAPSNDLLPSGLAWRQRIVRAVLTALVAGSYGALFVGWYVLTHGWTELMAQMGRLGAVAANEVRPTVWGEVQRFVMNVWNLGFRTPTKMTTQGLQGRDYWLVIATLGFVFLPVTKGKWLRLWMPVWLLVLMWGVFRKLNNVPLFFYPATIFLPLMAVGLAGVLTWVGELVARWEKNLRLVPAIVVLLLFGAASAQGAWERFESKIDLWTQHSVAEAEAAMKVANELCGGDDFMIVPKQIYWLARTERRSMLTFCARYNGVVNDMPVPVEIPREKYWFDCRLENARVVVMASGVDGSGRMPRGIDLVYCQGLKGVKELVGQMVREGWPIVYHGGRQVAYAPIGDGISWPVAVDGEYIVLANPRFIRR